MINFKYVVRNTLIIIFIQKSLNEGSSGNKVVVIIILKLFGSNGPVSPRGKER